MSEIAMFRAKTKKGNKWVYGELIHDNDRPYIVLDFYRKKSGKMKMKIKTKRVKRNTICIYTYQVDRDYTPIYEDDVVEVNNNLYMVCDIKGEKEKLYDFKNDEFKLIEFYDKDIKVIGNLYDNPELVEKIKSEAKSKFLK